MELGDTQIVVLAKNIHLDFRGKGNRDRVTAPNFVGFSVMFSIQAVHLSWEGEVKK